MFRLMLLIKMFNMSKKKCISNINYEMIAYAFLLTLPYRKIIILRKKLIRIKCTLISAVRFVKNISVYTYSLLINRNKFLIFKNSSNPLYYCID